VVPSPQLVRTYRPFTHCANCPPTQSIVPETHDPVGEAPVVVTGTEVVGSGVVLYDTRVVGSEVVLLETRVVGTGVVLDSRKFFAACA
jgi:hypothetical protein